MRNFKKHILYQEDIHNILNTIDTDELSGKTFLVTGATGMVGVMLIDVLMKLPHTKVIAVGRSKAKAQNRLGEYYDNSNFNFMEQDVQVPFPEDLKVDYIIPLASNTHPMAYSQFPIETMLINIEGARNALDLAVSSNATVIYPSSVEIYGNSEEGHFFVENSNGKLNLANSRACYTESKRSCEALCQSYKSERNVKIKIVRLCRIFGPTMLMSDTKASSQFIIKAINNEDIVLKSEGNQYFSYIYVADAVAAILNVLLKGQDGEAYNISNLDTNVHLKDFANQCALYNNRKVLFDLPSEAEKKGFSIASTAILVNHKLLSLGFVPLYNLCEGIKRTIEILKTK